MTDMAFLPVDAQADSGANRLEGAGSDAGLGAGGGHGGGPNQPAKSRVRTYPMRFTGDTREYFRIWIVNVALTVVTLGFYAPWARVRTRQYLYGNTWLAGQNFEYTANPWALLRGYLIVGAFSLLSSVSTQFPFKGSEWVVGAVVFLFVALFPWLVRQSMRFLARSTVHRGLNFRFTGSVGGAYVAYGLAYLPLLVASGLAAPWVFFTQRRYQIDHLNYGSARGRFRGEVGEFFKIGLIGLALGIAGGVVLGGIALGFASLLGLLGKHAEQAFDQLSPVALGVGIGLFYLGVLLLNGVAGQYVRMATMRYVLNNVELGGVVRVGANFNPWTMVWISVSNSVLQVLSLGLLIPWATIRRTKYLIENTEVRAIASLDDFSAGALQDESALGEAATELMDINIGF